MRKFREKTLFSGCLALETKYILAYCLVIFFPKFTFLSIILIFGIRRKMTNLIFGNANRKFDFVQNS